MLSDYLSYFIPGLWNVALNKSLKCSINSGWINLLKFKIKAEYADGRSSDLSGKEAYAIYAQEVQEHLKKVGAKLTFSGKVKDLLIGEVEDLWDSVAIAEYPDKSAKCWQRLNDTGCCRIFAVLIMV